MIKNSKAKPFRAGRSPDAVTENMEILTGQRGNRLDRAVTYRDLVDSGLANRKGLFNLSTVAEGIGPELVLDERVQVPHAPVGVTAYGGFATITLTWNNPTFRGFAHAEIFRSANDANGNPIDDVTQAILIATTPALVFGDAVDTYTAHYYWVRFVNTNGYQGPFHAVNGVFCETTETEQTIIADRVVSGIEVISPIITGGEIRGAVGKFGAGGPYAGYHTYIDSNGKLYTDNIVASGGSFNASLIAGKVQAGQIETSSFVLQGQTFTLTKMYRPANINVAGSGTTTVINKVINIGPSKSATTGLIVRFASGGGAFDGGSGVVKVFCNGSQIGSHSLQVLSSGGGGTYCCGSYNDGDCDQWCESGPSTYIQTAVNLQFVADPSVVNAGNNTIVVQYVMSSSGTVNISRGLTVEIGEKV